MAALVSYSDSDPEEDNDRVLDTVAPRKKRRISFEDSPSDLPPLPASFLDQYSSTVRTSTRDDPSLHAGRKRVTPHVEGNWPTHVYLEWHAPRAVAQQVNDFLTAFERPRSTSKSDSRSGKPEIHSLLQSNLGVPLPLHISLSRPLVLRTEQKDSFLRALSQAIAGQGIRAFDVTPKDLAWHPNESNTRWFLVLRLHATSNHELGKILVASNDVARTFNQPQLYVDDSGQDSTERFHLSLAWSLSAPDDATPKDDVVNTKGSKAVGHAARSTAIEQLKDSDISFAEVKIRIGQEVHVIPLKARRRSSVVS